MPEEKDLIPVSGTRGPGNYKDSSGNYYYYDGTKVIPWSEYNASQEEYRAPTNSTSRGGTSGGSMADFDAADFASTTKLPKWGSDFIKNVSGKYNTPSWDAYQASLQKLYTGAPGAIEMGRKASENQFFSDFKMSAEEQARSLAARQAATGTTNSSVGTDQISVFAQQAIAAAMKQQEVNTGAAEKGYQNLVDSAAAAQSLTGMIGEYLAKTPETYVPIFAGLDFDPGDSSFESDSGAGYNVAGGMQEGVQYGEDHGDHWTQPGGDTSTAWTHIQSHSNDKDKNPISPGHNWITYSYKGQTFDFDSHTGQVTNIRGETGVQSLDAEDMAGKSGLEDFAVEEVKKVVDQYGEGSLAAASARTQALNKYAPDSAEAKLNQQYAGLSAQTVALLKTALASAFGGGLSASYAGARGDELTRASTLGRDAIYRRSQQWGSEMSRRQQVDAVNASQGMATQIGGLLGTAKYKYDPNVSSYLSLYGNGSGGYTPTVDRTDSTDITNNNDNTTTTSTTLPPTWTNEEMFNE